MFPQPCKVASLAVHVVLYSFTTTESIHQSDNHGSAVEIASPGIMRKVQHPGSLAADAEAVLSEMGVESTHEVEVDELGAAAARPTNNTFPGSMVEGKWINYAAAGRVDCAWNGWSGWGTCTHSCGIGVKQKARTKARENSNSGKPCDDPNLYSIALACNEFPCPIDCDWAEWQEWTVCTTSCGGGMKEQVRQKNHTAEHAGKLCDGSHIKPEPCNTDPCPIDCVVSEWAEWGNCTEECGGGDRYRNAHMMVNTTNGGADCPPMNENEVCNEDVCAMQAGARRLSGISVVSAFLLVVATMFMISSSLED